MSQRFQGEHSLNKYKVNLPQDIENESDLTDEHPSEILNADINFIEESKTCKEKTIHLDNFTNAINDQVILLR